MLYIITKNWNSMPNYIFQGLKDEHQIEVVDFEKLRMNWYGKILKFLRAYVIRRRGLWVHHFYSERFLHAISKIAPSDAVLFFAVKNMKDLRILSHDIAAGHTSVFLWDPISWIRKGFYRKVQYRIFMQMRGIDVCTFDPVDARNFHFRAVSQVYRWPDWAADESQSITSDIFFVGQDKQRAPELIRLIRLFTEAGARLDFNIIRDKKSVEHPELAGYYMTQLMPYSQTLERLSHSRCLIEITQQGQSGLTLRTMEALFLGKKLITNNPYVRDYDFYHPNNILIYGDATTSADVKTFLDKPVMPLSRDLIDQYDIRNWIRQFLL